MERNIMTYQTPHNEIVRRYNDESARVYKWAEKAQAKVNASYKKLDVHPALIDYLNRRGQSWKFMGYVEWESPKNGDKWYGFCIEYKDIHDDMEYKWIIQIPVYYWDTVAHYGMIFWSNINCLDENDEPCYEDSIWIYTSHCIQRIKDRMNADYDRMTMMLFMFALNEFSVGYKYMRGKRMTFEIANQFGVFRTDYRKGTKADPIRTFIAKEELSTIDRKRYERKFKVAQEKIFNKPRNNDTRRTEPVVEPADCGGERPHSVANPDQARAQRVRSMLPPIDRGMAEIIRRAAGGNIPACDR